MSQKSLKPNRTFQQRWSIAFKVIPVVALVAILKLLSHVYKFEFMELNALFTSLVAGTIFLLGFLITGVLSDYKESERLPSELVGTLRSLFDDAYTIYKEKNSDTARQFIEFQKSFISSLIDWFYKRERTNSILNKISSMNDFFATLGNEGIQPNYIIKMKNEQNTIRRIILRIDTIRDTGFVASAYAILEIMWIAIAVGLIIIKIEPFYVSLFLTILIMFLISYMFFLIRDLDNPFDYSAKGETVGEISLKPIRDFEIAIKEFN